MMRNSMPTHSNRPRFVRHKSDTIKPIGLAELRRAAQAKQRLMKNLHIIEASATHATSAVESFQGVLRTTESLSESIQDGAVKARTIVRRNPLWSLSLAMAAGYLLAAGPRGAHRLEAPRPSWWSGMLGAGARLLVDRLTAYGPPDRF